VFEIVTCPICNKRKAKRYCPAKSQRICAVCCGTEREVTIDCPSDCVYLIASRQHHPERRDLDSEQMPFPDHHVPSHVLDAREDLLARIAYTVCQFAQQNHSLVDTDVQVCLKALAQDYQTLTSGIIYENPPDDKLQRELYDSLKAAVAEYKQQGANQVMVSRESVLDSDVREALIFLTQLAAVQSNGRPKGRAFIDSLRSHFKPGSFAQESRSLILVP
jgi:hypothetical protein